LIAAKLNLFLFRLCLVSEYLWGLVGIIPTKFRIPAYF
jgi:hypothetical protein